MCQVVCLNALCILFKIAKCNLPPLVLLSLAVLSFLLFLIYAIFYPLGRFLTYLYYKSLRIRCKVPFHYPVKLNFKKWGLICIDYM